MLPGSALCWARCQAKAACLNASSPFCRDLESKASLQSHLTEATLTKIGWQEYSEVCALD